MSDVPGDVVQQLMYREMSWQQMYRGVGLTAEYDPAPTRSGGNYQHRQTVLITYGSVNWETATGSKPRHIYVIRRGTLRDTELGYRGDKTPGWWAWHDGRQKFFVGERLLTVAKSDVLLFEPGKVPAIKKGDPSYLPPCRSPSRRSRSRSRSRSHSRSRSSSPQ